MQSIFYLLGAVLLLSVGGCHPQPSGHTMPILQVESTIAISDTLAREMEFISMLESNFSTVIQPRVNAYLLSKEYRDGMPVRRGQLLFRLDASQLNTTRLAAEAALSSARVQLLEARNNYNRALPLARIEAISQSELDQYTASLASAEAALRSAEEQLRSARLNVGYTRIVAPIDGIASSSKAHAGDYVGPGTQFEVLATLSNNDSLTATLSIPMREYLNLAVDSVSYDNRNLLHQIRLQQADGEPYPYAGTYNYTLKDVAAGEGVIRLSVLFPNPDGALKAGQFARIKAEVGPRKAMVLIPQRAVTELQGEAAVWVIGQDSVVEYRPVKLGPTRDTLWMVSEGLQGGERVATSGQLKLHHGERVRF